jgi:coatomer subunit beta
MTSSRNVEEVALFLKKQLQKTQEADFDKAAEYRQLLIQSIHVTAIKFSEIAASVVHALMEFLGDASSSSALHVVAFVRCAFSPHHWNPILTKGFQCREVVEKFPHLRCTICNKLISALSDIKSGKVFRGILWILGEYVESVANIQATMREIRKVLGEIPILASEQRLLDEVNTGDVEASEEKEKHKEGGGRPKVLADGTYATETAFTSAGTANLESVKSASKPPLRSEST